LLQQLGFAVQLVRNPDWTRDEVILACDLVAHNGWHGLNVADPQVIELSDLLRQLDVHPVVERGPDFRNPNGVARKTYDIATRHPDYRGKQTNGGRHDGSVLEEFLADMPTMTALAQAIREAVADPVGRADESYDLDLENLSALEGRVLERLHLTRERSPKLRARKIRAVRKAAGQIACEACGFDFAKTYGQRGADFAECHHRTPLHVSGPIETRLEDLVLLCSNCHRMIHRQSPWLTFEQLCELIHENQHRS
jgi:5-methylcytosine-specific restriction enzyme A